MAQTAGRHLRLIPDDPQYKEARWFLEELSQRRGENPGPKGGLCLWGVISNHTDALAFVTVLTPFWQELLSGSIEGGPTNFNRVLVFYEEEQTEAANVYEIFWDDPASEGRSLQIHHHGPLPFAWMQY